MNTEHYTAKQRQLIVTLIVLVVVVLVVIGARAFVSKGRAQQMATTTSSSNAAATSTSSSASSSQTYRDGTYSATGNYDSPGGTESIQVSLMIKSGVVSNSQVQPLATDGTSQEYQVEFTQGYRTMVVGKRLDSIHLSGVSGSSLTSEGFNSALEQIKNKAKA